MLQLRFLICIILMLVMGIASVQIPVSGVDTEFSLENEYPLRLNGSLRSGDILLENIDIDDGSFTYIQFQGFHHSNIIGSPKLPEIHELIEIPQNSIPQIEIISEEYKYYNLC
mgnify:CR=1 FL=1